MIKMIVAVDGHGAIGREGNLLAHLLDDMAFFRKQTVGHGVLMGRKTYESLPAIPDRIGGKHLHNRYNFVLTREQRFYGRSVETLGSVNEALFIAKSLVMRDKYLWVIGGAEIYKLFAPYVEEVYVTHINHVFQDADAFFPADFLTELECTDKWDYEHVARFPKNQRNDYSFEIVKYTRIKEEE